MRDFKLTPRFGDLTFLRSAAAVTLEAVGLGAMARRLSRRASYRRVDGFGSTACSRFGSRTANSNTAVNWFRRRSGDAAQPDFAALSRFMGLRNQLTS